MARLFTDGLELQDTSTPAGFLPLVIPSGSNPGVFNTNASFVRTGLVSGLLSAGAGNTSSGFRGFVPGGVTANKTFFLRCYFYFPSFPAAGIDILNSNQPTAGVSVHLNTDGTLQLWDNSGNLPLSATTFQCSINTWYCVELSYALNASNQATAQSFRIDEQLIASSSSLLPSAVTGQFGFGIFRTGAGVNYTIYIDDIAVNDESGAVQNSWPGAGKVQLLVPTADSSVGSGWTTSAAASTGLWDNVNNKPPTGIADTTSNAGHQIRNASAITVNYDATMETYSTKGIAASDLIKVITPIIAVAAPVTTAAKTGSVGCVSNPAITNIAFAANTGQFWSGVAAATHPTGWKWEQGTITYAPTVTVGTSPVMRVSITGGTAARIAMVEFMGMVVDYLPSAPPPAQPISNAREVAVMRAATR
jgi:hypothetical protein